MTVRSVAANSVEMPTPLATMVEPPVTNATMPPSPKLVYIASHSPSELKPAVAAMIATSARAPSPDEPR